MAVTRRALVQSVTAVLGAGATASCARRGRAGRASATPKPTGAKAKDPSTPLVVGSVGTTFGLAGTYEAQIAAALQEALIDLNTSGGVFGKDVTLVPRIVVETPETDMAVVVAQLQEQGVTAAIVSCGDAELTAAMEHFAAADIVVLSPNSTSMTVRADPTLDNGLLFRLVPNDAALAATYAEESTRGSSDGTPLTVALCTRDGTPQSESMLGQLQSRLNGIGGAVQHLPHPAEPFDGMPIAEAIIGSPPGVVVLNGGPESLSILAALAQRNLDERGQPQLRLDVQLGVYASLAYGDALPPKAMNGFHGSRSGQPITEAGGAFYDEMLNANPDFLAAGCDDAEQAYDALMLIAFGAQFAHSAAGTQIATALPDLLGDGDECEQAEACLTVLRQRGEIKYVPRSGAITFGPDRDLAKGTMTGFSYSDANLPTELQASNVDAPS